MIKKIKKEVKKDIKKDKKVKKSTKVKTNKTNKIDKKVSKISKVTKDRKTEKKKKEESYFIALLKKKDLISASWKIDAPVWIKRIETDEKDPAIKQYLFIDISSIENGKYKRIDSIPVQGLKNSWHIFVKNEYSGKRLILSLSYRDKKGKFSDILVSEEIDIPYSIESIRSDKNYSSEENILLEISELKLAGLNGSDNTSW
jgi:hypothetical protein